MKTSSDWPHNAMALFALLGLAGCSSTTTKQQKHNKSVCVCVSVC